MLNMRGTRKNVLAVIRFSALGDCVMLATVLEELAEKYPHLQLLVITRRNALPYFKFNKSAEVLALEDFDNNIPKLGTYINTHYVLQAIADMHNNLRSNYLRILLRMAHPLVKQTVIYKGRKQKRLLTRQKHKKLQQLQAVSDRYADVLRKAGYPLTLTHNRQAARLRHHQRFYDRGILLLTGVGAVKPYVGIAPFARHKPKEMPISWVTDLIRELNTRNIVPLLFGGGAHEKLAGAKLEKECRVINCIGVFDTESEIACLTALQVMVTADSANMHIASFTGTRVISLWGPTHPFAGFLGYGQNYTDAVQAEDPHRPNSVFGNRELLKNGRPIMFDIDLRRVAEAVVLACEQQG